MGKLLIINGSPRAPKSNSKRYAALLKAYMPRQTDEYNVTEKRHKEIVDNMAQYSDILLVFPLYADALPVPLMEFLKVLREHRLENSLTVHVLVNCGFLEPEQNDLAVELIRLFCKRSGFAFGMTLQIGGGEAILDTPFAFLVKRRMKKLAEGMLKGESKVLCVRMPLTKKGFIRAAEKFWVRYGEKNHITKEEMERMEIEQSSSPAETIQ